MAKQPPIAGPPPPAPVPAGYSRYSIRMDRPGGACEVSFEVTEDYELTRVLGEGTFGVVCQCKDRRTGDDVAIKRVPAQVFHRGQIPEDYARKVVRELRLMRHFTGHECLLGLKGIVCPPGPDYGAVYIIMPLMTMDMKVVLETCPEYLDDPVTVQRCLYYILNGLYAMHSANVMHRDLKPSNILLSEDGNVRISDFGLARGFDEASVGLLSSYVVTRWYRAPEVLLSESYTPVVDVWSVGCIFAQMLAPRDIQPALFPSKETGFRGVVQHLELVASFVGHNPADPAYGRWVKHRHAMSFLQRKLGARPRANPRQLFPDRARVPDTALQLMLGMLIVHPDARPRVEQCLQHVYFGEFRWDSEEKAKEERWPVFDQRFEELLALGGGQREQAAVERVVAQSRRLLNLEVSTFHPQFMSQPGVELPEDVDALRSTSGPAATHCVAAGGGWMASAQLLGLLGVLEQLMQDQAGALPIAAVGEAIVAACQGPEGQAVREALPLTGLAGEDGQPALTEAIDSDTAAAFALCIIQRMRAMGHPAAEMFAKQLGVS